MKKAAIFLFLTCAMCVQAFASEAFLVKATNDEDDLVTRLYLVLNHKMDIQQFKVKNFENENLIEEETFGVEQGEDGIVLERMKGKDIVTLYSENFSSHQGGDITLSYLYNGLTGSKGQLALDLRRDGDEWNLLVNGVKASHLHFESNRKFMVGAIGVKRVKVIK